MTDKHYILDDDHNILETGLIEWAQFFEKKKKRQVAWTRVNDATISTVFLGIDHNFSNEGAPLLFETMVFGGEHDSYTDRYATWKDAEIGHEKVVAIVSAKVPLWKQIKRKVQKLLRRV